MKNGVYKTYKKGFLEWEENYLDGVYHGDRIMFYENGEIRAKGIYKQGKLCFLVGYTEKGNIAYWGSQKH